MSISKIIQDNDTTITTSFMVFDEESFKKFQHRFVLLRGSNLNTKKIKDLRPELYTETNLTLEYWKLSHNYFIIDLLTNKCLLHCEYVKKSSVNYIKDLTPFLPYASKSPADLVIEPSEIIAKYDNILAENNSSLIIKNVFQTENKWFLITYNYLDTDKFIINTRAFVDFEKYFTRQSKIDRILEILESNDN